MSSDRKIIQDVLDRHYDEAADGMVDKSPSKLLRGEGTERDYFILKIDLVGSTGLLMKRQKSTYLKFAHTFLSTIDYITQQLGADGEQVEYAGDSVIAYFPESSTSAIDVLTAACFCRVAVAEMQKLDRTLGEMRFKCKIVLHHASLIVARIGPRAGSALLAIGFPLHVVAKLEKETPADTGRVAMPFYKKVDLPNRKYLQPLYSPKPAAPSAGLGAAATVSAPINAAESIQARPRSLAELFQAAEAGRVDAGHSFGADNAQRALESLGRGNFALGQFGAEPYRIPPPPIRQEPPEQIGATLKWDLLYAALRLDQP